MDRLEIGPLRADEQAAWRDLAGQYKAFYLADPAEEDYVRVWQRLQAQDGLYGLGARRAGQLLGITHYVFQPNVWLDEVCYLQDLFVAPAARGHGVARALIEQVAQAARARGAPKLYWLTQEHNQPARALYDKLARYGGFIRYDYPLAG